MISNLDYNVITRLLTCIKDRPDIIFVPEKFSFVGRIKSRLVRITYTFWWLLFYYYYNYNIIFGARFTVVDLIFVITLFDYLCDILTSVSFAPPLHHCDKRLSFCWPLDCFYLWNDSVLVVNAGTRIFIPGEKYGISVLVYYTFIQVQ